MKMAENSGAGMDKVVYTTCMCNCGSNHECVLKAHIKGGRVVAVEPDDRYNTGVGREDEVLSERELIQTKLQRRPCTKGLVFHKYLYHPDRLLYPLKRDPNSQRGEGKYVRISWDEALDTIAGRMMEAREKYGPYSVITPYMPNASLERLFSFWGAGVDSWGWCSWDATRLMVHLVAGTEGWACSQHSSGSAADMLAHSKLIVIWGFDPAGGSSGPGYQFAWFIKLARERGKKVIIFDPRYSVGAEVLADQWIPIKPGTDHAMFLAMAYVLFTEDLWDKAFVDRYVEPNGFEEWKNYILGKDDGIEKTPQWAEKECGVPAKTIHDLARLVATERPAWLNCHWGVSRKSHGEQTVRAFAGLQAALGYWGTPGAGPSLLIGPSRPIPFKASWGPIGPYNVPKMYRSHQWAQAVLLLPRVRRGELSEKEYMKMVGWKADPSLVREFRPKVLLWGGGNIGNSPHASDSLVTACESPNFQLQAIAEMDFIATTHSIMTPTASYADIILPAQDWMWEEKNITKTGGYGGFECINYCPGVVKPAGEVRPWAWIYTKLAEKLGVNPQSYFKYYTTDENWDRDWERYLMDGYNGVVDYYRARNIEVPSWEEFTKGKFINCDELAEEPFTGWDEQIKEGKPFMTESGKIEIKSNYIAKEENRGKGAHYDTFGRLIANLPSDWGTLTPFPIYRKPVRGMADPLVKEYPLMQISPHSRYRVHYLFWEHPWLRGQVYRHRVWISTTDAKARGIRDGDMVTVHNDRGTIVMQAYVTSRIMPGIIAIRHGGKYMPDEAGVDFGASPSTTLGGDFESCATPAKAATLVQVKKYSDGPSNKTVK